MNRIETAGSGSVSEWGLWGTPGASGERESLGFAILVQWPCENHITFQSLGFLICKMRIMIPSLQGYLKIYKYNLARKPLFVLVLHRPGVRSLPKIVFSLLKIEKTYSLISSGSVFPSLVFLAVYLS